MITPEVKIDTEIMNQNIEYVLNKCSKYDISSSLMIKDTYAHIPMWHFSRYVKTYCSPKQSRLRGKGLYYNYTLESPTKLSEEFGQKGGLIYCIEQLDRLPHNPTIFDCLVYSNYTERSLDEAIRRAKLINAKYGDKAKCDTIFFSSGCTGKENVSLQHIKKIFTIASYHFKKISVGGSFYIPYLNYFKNFIDELRFGEYAILGTIPFYDKGKLEKRDTYALKVTLKLAFYDEAMDEAFYYGGYYYLRAGESKLLTPDCDYIRESHDYTVCRVNGNPPDEITFSPSYNSIHTLSRLKLQAV